MTCARLSVLPYCIGESMEHNTEDRLRVGVITSSHGIKGEVKVYPTTDDNDRLAERLWRLIVHLANS